MFWNKGFVIDGLVLLLLMLLLLLLLYKRILRCWQVPL